MTGQISRGFWSASGPRPLRSARKTSSPSAASAQSQRWWGRRGRKSPDRWSTLEEAQCIRAGVVTIGECPVLEFEAATRSGEESLRHSLQPLPDFLDLQAV